MANWSSLKIELTGNVENINNLKNELINIVENGNLNPTNLPNNHEDEGYNIVYGIDIDVKENILTISGSGRWSGPYNYIKDLVKKYNLSGKYFDMEEGNDFSHLILFENGEVDFETDDYYFSKLSILFYGINFWINRQSWIIDQDNWKEDYAHVIELFKLYGVSCEQLEKEWSC